MEQTSGRRGRPVRWTAASRLALVQLVVLAVAWEAFAQDERRPPQKLLDELEQACRKASEADEAERALITELKSPAVDAALQSESAFWQFLIDPSTPYIERIAVAYRGGGRVSPEQLPRLWKARAALKLLPTGVSPTPCAFSEYNSWHARSPWAWKNRSATPIPGTVSSKLETGIILGLEVSLPQRAVDYPLDVNSRSETPWIWQMERTVNILVPRVRAHYEHSERYGSMAEIALSWRPSDYFEREIRVEALSFGPPTALWVRALVRLALDEAPQFGEFYHRGAGSVHLEELKHVAQIAILQKTTDFGIAGGSAELLADMANRDSYLHPIRTATSVLAIGRWALDPNRDVHSRYCLAASICRIIPDPLFKRDFQLRPNGPEEAQALTAFEAWFAKERPRLLAESATELAHLNDLAAELDTQISPPLDAVKRQK